MIQSVTLKIDSQIYSKIKIQPIPQNQNKVINPQNVIDNQNHLY